MGQFSWIRSDNGKAVLSNHCEDTFLLVPEKFQDVFGPWIGGQRMYYDGYGRFGKEAIDVYEVVALWNRAFLDESMLRDKPKFERFPGMYPFELAELRKQGLTEAEVDQRNLEIRLHFYNQAVKRYKFKVQRLLDYRNGVPFDEMERLYGKEWKREIGISIACYDEQNKSLPYPIKIVSEPMAYSAAGWSKSDPNQGWGDEDDLY